MIVEDVTTAGTSIRDTVPKLLATADVKLAGLMISVDRRERGTDSRAALDQLSEEFDMPCEAIVQVQQGLEYLSSRGKVWDRPLQQVGTIGRGRG